MPRLLGIRLELGAQTHDEVVDRAQRRVLHAPHLAQQGGARQHPLGVVEKVQEYRKFLRRHGDFGRTLVDPMAVAIHPHVGKTRRRWRAAGRRRAPQVGTDARTQLGESERFGDVVVGAQFEPEHLVGLIGAGGQQDDRHLAIAGTQTAQQFEAVAARQHQIEHH